MQKIPSKPNLLQLNDLAMTAFETMTALLRVNSTTVRLCSKLLSLNLTILNSKVFNDTSEMSDLSAINFIQEFSKRTFRLDSRTFYINAANMRIGNVEFLRMNKSSGHMEVTTNADCRGLFLTEQRCSMLNAILVYFSGHGSTTQQKVVLKRRLA